MVYEMLFEKLYEISTKYDVYIRFQINVDENIFLNFQILPEKNLVCTDNVFGIKSRRMDVGFVEYLETIIKNTNEWKRIRLKYYGKKPHRDVVEVLENFYYVFENLAKIKNAKLVVDDKFNI